MANFRLDGAVVLVTGAARGIGAATCAALAEAGATVVATDMHEDARVPGAAEYHRLDVTSPAQWAATITAIEVRYGRLDVLVNNAGLQLTTSIADTSDEAWRQLMAVNVDGVFYGTRAATDLLARSGERRAGGSCIINLSSIGGLQGAAFLAAYCTSKGAVKLFTKSCAAEFGALSLPIRANSVCPGGIQTEMLDEILEHYVTSGAFTSVEDGHRTIEGGHLLKRLGKAEEVAAGIVYLASPASSFMTGTELVIDGGMTAA
ncbi:SDR family oxidoreductase [Novosphingobium sp. KCTC 2891]|uniref:SDR family oxidoreductase n=1 Tax=Novosphingobium sp. KCTC 2891 TaxID=2989730 RepID=UPI002223B7E1|nr:SDR family oxidoreductase [Novosphingobium sp. KCTC 2891]MCW1384865.1 SDR family oxidoreductase [Novosphingobium sp. KCTC 2891]